MLPRFSYVRPDTVKEVLAQLAEGKAVAHAGGTDLIGCLRDDVFHADKLVSLSRLQELRGIEPTSDGGMRIGALATITEVAEHPLVRERYTGLAMGASEVASPQLRNQGTIGGNLCQKPRCWYYRGEFLCLRKGGGKCFAIAGENQFHAIFGGDGICVIVHPSDTAPNLAALNARIHITGPAGKRTVPAEDFHVLPGDNVMKETVLTPGEIVTHISLPPAPKGLRSRYRKIRARRSWDFALAGVALALVMDGDTVTDGRVVLSGVAPVPWRVPAVEAAIKGRALTPEVIGIAADAAVDGAEPLEQNGYKVPLLRAAVAEELAAVGTAA